MKHSVLAAITIFARSVSAFSVLPSTPTQTAQGRYSVGDVALEYKMDEIVHCATDGYCSAEQMEDMLLALDELNSACTIDDDALEECGEMYCGLRQTLKEALELRLDLHSVEKRLQENIGALEENGDEQVAFEENHSFDHYLDYKSIAQYESH